MPTDRVSVSLDRVVEMAKRLGSLDVDECPPARDCWRKRHPDEYDPTMMDECATCWVEYGLGGVAGADLRVSMF